MILKFGQIKKYPLPLWVLFFYLSSLAFSFKYDVPLALFSIITIATIFKEDIVGGYKNWVKRHWHILFFLFASALATVFSKNPRHSLDVQVHFIPCLLIYMAIVSSCQNWDHLQFLIIAIVVAGLITGVYILASITLSEATDPMDKVLGIKSALVTVPNDILYLSVLVSPSLFLLLYRGAGLIVRTLALAYLITAFVTIVYLQSRQAVGVYILSVLVFCFWLRPLLGLWVALGLLFAVLILDWFFGGGLIGKLVVLFPRRYVWDAAWHMFLDSPITGLGPGEFKENYQAYLVKAGYLSVEDHRPMKWAHSLYFEQLAERGGIGLLALMVLLGRPLGKLLTNLLMQFKKNGRMLRSNSYLYDIVWISTLTALLISGIGEASLMRIWVVTTIFMSIGIIEVVSGMALRNGQGAA